MRSTKNQEAYKMLSTTMQGRIPSHSHIYGVTVYSGDWKFVDGDTDE